MMPVLSELATPLDNIKKYIKSKQIKIKSVELIGGASRIPFFQSMVSNIFNIENSRTLNASEAIARGSNIYSAL